MSSVYKPKPMKKYRFHTTTAPSTTRVCAPADSPSTQVSADGKNILIYLWYDNEFGYSLRCVALVEYLVGRA